MNKPFLASPAISPNVGLEVIKGSTRDCGLRARLANPAAFLSRTDLRELGLERRAVDAVFRACDVIVFPGYRRPLIRVSDYLELLKRSTYGPDRVR
jgi:hypothetical protein